jgi:hypothetical protein
MFKRVKSINSLILTINQQEISLICNYTSKSKNQETYTFFKESKQNISELIFQKTSYKIVTAQGTTNQEEVSGRLFIEISNKKYRLDYNLTQGERYWLSQEISEFLGKEITWE